jgi:spermidine/putrescine transport system substrate-binding protein
MNLFQCLSVLFLLSACSSSENELHIYTWSNYFDPKTLEKFENEYNCKIVINMFDSNESMYAKLKLGSAKYDLIFPSNYYADLMAKQGMLSPIDKNLLPNYQFVDPVYLKLIDDPTYAIPYLITWTGIAYRKDKIGDQTPSWDLFNRKDLRGRMTMLNDPRELIGAALKYFGYSSNSIDKTEIDEAANQAIQWKGNLAKFESEQYKNGIASGEYLLVQGYAGELSLVNEENPDVVFALPEEGTTFSIDMITLSKEAQEELLAYAFINYILDPEVAAQNMIYTKFPLANRGALDKIPARLKENPALFPPAAIIEKSELIKNLGEKTELYNKAWDKIKAE